MILLTRKCQYGLRALYILAREYGNGPIMIHQISVEANAPAGFLQGILLELKNARVLESRRGVHGGYRLLKPPDQVTVGSIIRILDGPFVTLPCADDPDARACDDCRDGSDCRTRHTMREVQRALVAILDGITLEMDGATAPAQDTPRSVQGV